MFFGNDAPPLPDPRFRHRPPGEPRNTLSSIREKIGDHFVEQRLKELHERLIQNAEEKHHRKTLRNETLAASVGGILDPSLAGQRLVESWEGWAPPHGKKTEPPPKERPAGAPVEPSTIAKRPNEVDLPEGFKIDRGVTEKFLEEFLKFANAGQPSPKRLRKLPETFQLNEQRKLKATHYESWIIEHEASQAAAAAPKLATGQAVQHWWAGWFKDAESPPMQLKGEKRPAWYDAQIYAAIGIKDVKYAGQPHSEHCYQVH